MTSKIDWRTLLMGLPTQRFTPAERARAGAGPASWTLRLVALFNMLPLTGALLVALAPANPWYWAALVLVFSTAVLLTLEAAWRDPSQRWVRRAYYVLPLLAGMALGLMMKRWSLSKEAVALTAVLMVGGTLALWFVILYRHAQMAARLRELNEQAHAQTLTRRLATAQIQPHFLFNALATLQHWVATQDARAAPLLESLTGYLRATLPLFDRERLTLAQECEAVHRYLEVMQARLGARLAFDIELPDALARQHLPPGVLLTLVENAIEHGVQPQLAGGRVRVSLWRDGARLHARVADSGAGAPAALLDGATSGGAHLGLANTRARLAAIGGALTLTNPPEGGCAATLTWPFEESPPCAP